MSEQATSPRAFIEPPSQEVFLSGKLVRRFLGFVFAFTAIGLWLAPGASSAADVLLLKTGFTSVLTFCAIIALLPSR